MAVLIGLAAYLCVGGVIAAWMVVRGLPRFDALAGEAPLRVRLIWGPGIAALWPLIVWKLRRTAS